MQNLDTKRKRGLLLIVIALLILALLLGLWLYGINRRIPAHTTLGGLEIGDMTYREASAAVKTAVKDSALSRNLSMILPEETLELSPEEAGIKLHLFRALEDACRGEGEALGLLPYLTMEEAYFQSALQGYADHHDTELTQTAWTLEGGETALETDRFDPETPARTLTVTMGIPKRHLNQEKAWSEICGFYDQAFGPEQRECALSMEVPPEEVPETLDLEALAESCCVSPVDDSLDMTTYQFVPGSYGCRFDIEQAREKLEQADWGVSVTLPMTYVEPEILGDEVYFRDVLGTCETRHNDNENRNTNLRLVCEILNGVVIAPGEEFSYNQGVGERTPERGFKPAPAYSGMRVVQAYGGGVCQGATTLYNCALLADMEITARVCHGADVGYVPRGLDATVNWSTNTDMAFRNTSHFPVKIEAKVEDGYMKMKLLGTDEKDYYIEMKSGWGEDDVAVYATSYRCKISKETGEEISREREAFSTYYKNFVH